VLAEDDARDVALVVHVGDLGRVGAARLQPDKVGVESRQLLVVGHGVRVLGAHEKVEEAVVEALEVQRKLGRRLPRGGLGHGDAGAHDFFDVGDVGWWGRCHERWLGVVDLRDHAVWLCVRVLYTPSRFK
jgi:hypothetical protein